MHSIERLRADTGLVDRAQRLVALASSFDGHEAISEPERIALLAMLSGPRLPLHDDFVPATGFVVLAAVEPGDGALKGLLFLSSTPELWTIQIVIHPKARDDGIEPELLTEALAMVSNTGGGKVQLWQPQATPKSDALAGEFGFTADRDLLQMRLDLSLSARDQVPPVTLRSFRPGFDEAAWVAVNNRAFAGHPEQGHWTVETLLERERQPWFDPRDFLLYEVEGDILGFCWVKRHPGSDPATGEIYVIAVDPVLHGKGIGKRLLLAGLEQMRRMSMQVAMLYVDGTNTAAVALYTSLGFTVDHVDRAYVTVVG